MKKDILTELEFVVFTNRDPYETVLAKGEFDLTAISYTKTNLPAIGHIGEKYTHVKFSNGTEDLIVNLPYEKFKALRKKVLSES